MSTDLYATGHAQHACDAGDGAEYQAAEGETVSTPLCCFLSSSQEGEEAWRVTCLMKRSFPPRTAFAPW